MSLNSFIPEGTAVVVPPYTLFRDPANFSPCPDTFWPERWLHSSASKRTPAQALAEANAPQSQISEKSAPVSSDKEDIVNTNTAAFIPFSYGPANCAGRNLALVEMRMVVALLMQRFDMRFADGYDPGLWEEEIQDFVVVTKEREATCYSYSEGVVQAVKFLDLSLSFFRQVDFSHEKQNSGS